MLEFTDLSVSHGSTDILKHVSFAVPSGLFCAVIGKNGAGKTTLVNCINRQQNYRGRICLDGVDIQKIKARQLAQKIAILPQILPSPEITVEELVCFGRNPYLGINQRLTDKDRSIIDNALQRTGITALRSCPLPTLSGGERQKAFLSMTLAQSAPVLILDEPTTHLDITAETEFLTLLKSLSDKGKTLLVIMHNLSMAVKYADYIVIIDGNQCIFSGSTSECLEGKHIERAFRVRRVDAADEVFFTGHS